MPKLGFWLLLAALLTLFILYRHSKRAYAAFVGAVIISMVATPLLQSQQVAAYSERRETEQLEAEIQAQGQAATQQAQDELLTSSWNPHQEPLAVSGPPSAVSRQRGFIPRRYRRHRPGWSYRCR